MTNERPRILVADKLAPEGIELLETVFAVDVRTGMDEDEVVAAIGDYDGLVVRSATAVTPRVVEAAHRLKVIARAGAGLDTIDVEAARARDITIINSPDANTLAVAELTMGLIVTLARNVTKADAAMKEGRWEKSALLGSGLVGKTLGIVGFGRIGQAVATRAQAFGMRVVANQHRPTPELYLEAGVEPLDLDDLLAQADYVTLHVPMKPETEAMMGADQFARMKQTAFLINTSRGGVIDEQELLAALDAGELAGAALDVFSVEPATDNPLTTHPKVVATPHLGASTADAQVSAAIDVAEKLIELLGAKEQKPVLPLRFVDLEQVVPHEAVDPRRARRLAARLEEEGILANPPVVAQVGDRYVVLDGATRTSALRHLGYAHAIVQDVDRDSGLELETWHHVVRQAKVDDLVGILQSVEGTTVEQTDPADIASRMIEYGALCSLRTVDGRGYLVFADAGESRFDAVARVAEAYIEQSVVSRILEHDLPTVVGWYPDMTGLVEYPQFSVEQVLTAAGSGRLLPAGVTRFVIPGRVLRLNAPLSLLADDGRSIEEKNRWLFEELAEKERTGRIRYYREPVYLLDE